ncbi:MAG: 3'-5' exonuclease domain-containing protein 2, partial [Prevotellaceae bacterium]|nr:3'-5' exonuclease domain-containing protein 2 [Prevotellaceae bacterium]
MSNFVSKIEKGIVATMPVVKTDCEIVVIDNEKKVDSAVKDLYKSAFVGFDTETKPSFTRGKINKIALLQLSTEKKCYLFRLQLIGKSQVIKEFLESSEILKIGLSTR